MSPKKVAVYVLYYGAAAAIGFFLGLLQVPETDYYLDGKRVNERLTSTEFVMENLSEVRTKTTIDLDKVPNVFLVGAIGNPIKFLPSFTIEGDASTPATVSRCAIGSWIILALLAAGWTHRIIRSR